MTTTFQTVGEPWNKSLFNLKDKIYYEMVHRLLRMGRRYVPHYFVRGMTGYLLTSYKHTDLVGVEIGTQDGFNAKVMMLVLPMKQLFCIDPYEDYTEDMGQYRKKNIVGNNVFWNAQKYLKEFGDSVVFYRNYSGNVYNRFEDNSLDFVYIDGNHSYSYVMDDITKYIGKVKPGGVLGGHDYGSRYGGVVHAVNDYTRTHNLDLYTGRDADWWIIK